MTRRYKIVQVRRGEAPAIKRNQGTQFRRNDRDDVQNHPLWLVAALAEGLDHFEALGVLEALLQRGFVLHLLAQLGRKRIDLDPLKKFLDRLGAHHGLETGRTILLVQFAVLGLVLDNLAFFDRGIAGLDCHVRFEVENGFEIAQGDVEQVADAAGQTL